MAWSQAEKESALELILPVQCGKGGESNGTSFPIHVTEAEAWYVTCDHVVKNAEQPSDVSVGDATALQIERGKTKGLDLALVKVPVRRADGCANAAAVLALAPQRAPAGACYIPGCYRPEPGKGSLLREGVDGKLTGERADVFASVSTPAMKGWSLNVDDDDLLQKGYSGAPVLSTSTGRVFAVAAWRSDGGKGGIAICISNLEQLLPPELRGLLPANEAHELSVELRALLDTAAGFQLQAAWAVVLRSAPETTVLGEMPRDVASFSDWLLDYKPARTPPNAGPGGQPRTQPRDALYDVLLWLEQRAEGDEARIARIRRCCELRLHEYPDLDTSPLRPLPAEPDAEEPHLIEVVLDPLPGSTSERGYTVQSYFHPGDGSDYRPGPVREPQHGGLLDPDDRSQVQALVQDLTRHGLALGLTAKPCIFQFRLPLELLLRGVERWPKNLLKQPLGDEYPVVLAADAELRDWSQCERHWRVVRVDPAQPLRRLAQCCRGAGDRELTDAELHDLMRDLERTPCLVLDAPPVHPEPDRTTHLYVIAVIGVLALWPRPGDVSKGLCESLVAQLGDTPLHRLPFVLRDLRRDGGDETAVALRELALFWDDPGRSARRPSADGFHPGFGTLTEPVGAAAPAAPTTAETPA